MPFKGTMNTSFSTIQQMKEHIVILKGSWIISWIKDVIQMISMVLSRKRDCKHPPLYFCLKRSITHL
jgi:hypothetical protein